MSAKYEIIQDGAAYMFARDGQTATTPMGAPLSTASRELAELVLPDLDQYGPDPRRIRSWSYVTFLAGYCDFGCSVPRAELIDNILIGYDEEEDAALAAGVYFENLQHKPGFMVTDQFLMDPVIYFGRKEPRRKIQKWLQGLSTRALISVQTIGGNCCSVHVSYRLFNPDQPDPAKALAKGLAIYGRLFDIQPIVIYEPDEERAVYNFLVKARRFADFPDD